MPDKLFPDIPAFLHLFLIFKHHIASLAPGAAVYGGAGCIPFHYLQFERAVYLFTPLAAWKTCRVYPFHNQQLGSAGCILSTTSSFRVCPFPPPAVMTCKVYLFAPRAVRTCRVYPFHHQQYAREGFWTIGLDKGHGRVEQCRCRRAECTVYRCTTISVDM
jgi:hypothetical protein